MRSELVFEFVLEVYGDVDCKEAGEKEIRKGGGRYVWGR